MSNCAKQSKQMRNGVKVTRVMPTLRVVEKNHIMMASFLNSSYSPDAGKSLTKSDCIKYFISPSHLKRLNLPVDNEAEVKIQLEEELDGKDSILANFRQLLV